MKRLIVCLALIAAACGSNPSPTAPPAVATQAAAIAVSSFTASVEGATGSLTYRVSLRIAETGGKTGANITAFTFTFDNGGTATSTGSPVHVSASSTVDTTSSFLDSTGRPASARLSVTLAFTDDGGRAGSATNATAVTVVAPIVRADVVGTVRDAVTRAGLGGATLRITNGPDSGKTATAAADGYFVLGNVQVGAFTVQASAAGHVTLSQTVTLAAGNTTTDFALVVTPPAVEYRLTGTARRCSATYENSTGGTNQSRVDIPFSYSWNGARTGDFLYMSCQIDTPGDPGTLTVAIYKNGVFYRSGMANGFPNIASASGSF